MSSGSHEMCCSYGISSSDTSKISTSWSGLSTVAGEILPSYCSLMTRLCDHTGWPAAFSIPATTARSCVVLFAMVLPGVSAEMKEAAEQAKKSSEHGED